uniref:Orf 144 n=1 Tax=Pneumocystis carinii TaxID=4754 RepID=D2XDV1_PNECA|nr:orf 144 [Pneumocystis carinii]
MNEIASSSPEMAMSNARGINPNMKKRTPEIIIWWINPAIIFISIWPANTLAPSLIPRENPLEMYNTSSITAKKGIKTDGTPEGIKKEKKFHPWCFNPMIVAPINTTILKETVKTKCEVTAKEYGIIPMKLLSKINTKIEKMKGK